MCEQSSGSEFGTCPRESVDIRHRDGPCEHILSLLDSLLPVVCSQRLAVQFCDHLLGSSQDNCQSITHVHTDRSRDVRHPQL